MIKLPRKRLLNACDECRKRKVRCDSATVSGEVCTECLKWKTECTHSMPNKRRGPKVGSSRRPSAHNLNLKRIVSSIVDSVDSYTLPEDLGLVRTLVIDLALYVRSLETQLRHTLNSLPSSSSANTPSAPHECGVSEVDAPTIEAGDTDALASQFEEILALDDNRYYGSSSTFQFVQAALNIKGELSGGGIKPSIKVKKFERPELWTIPKWQSYPTYDRLPYLFPEDDLLHDLIDLYFTYVDPYFPMLHRPTIERSLSNGAHLTDRRFGAIILMICCLASQHSNDRRTLFEGIESEYSKGWKYFRQIQLVHQFQETPSIYEFQLYPLASLYLHTTNISSAAFFLVAIGIRYAHQRGVNERGFVVQDDPVETELWRRAFWCLVIFDIYASTTLGRPRATIPENVDTDYPQVFNDELIGESREKNASGIFSQPGAATKPSPMSFWKLYIKLFEVIGNANRAFYSVKPSELWTGMGISRTEWYQKAVIELDAALNKWVESIPNHLRWDPQNQNELFLRQSSMLYATYYWAQFQVHKPFISRSSRFEALSPFPSLTICANSARFLIGLLETQYRQHSFVALPLLIGPLFDSAIVLLINLWRGLRNLIALDPSKELGDVRRCIGLLGLYEQRYQAAGRLCDLLNSVISANLPERRSLKRARTLAGELSPALSERTAFDWFLSRNGTGSRPAHIDSGDCTTLDPVLQHCSLPHLSHELGTLPLHTSWDLVTSGRTGADIVYPENDPFVGALSWEASSNETSQQKEDWESFMAGIDSLLQFAETSFIPESDRRF